MQDKGHHSHMYMYHRPFVVNINVIITTVTHNFNIIMKCNEKGSNRQNVLS